MVPAPNLRALPRSVGQNEPMSEAPLETNDGFAFVSAFSIVIDPEFPGNGVWDCPTFGFDRDGRVVEDFYSGWGSPMVVRFERQEGEGWVGMFSAGGLGGISGVFSCPSPDRVLVVAGGLAYFVDVSRPDGGAVIVHDQVDQVFGVNRPALLLLARFIDIVALGIEAVEWKTGRLSMDDLRIVSSSSTSIICSGENFGGSPTIALDPLTGLQVEGSTLRDLGWPPGQ